MNCTRLRTNALEQPLGVDAPSPEFAWMLTTRQDDVRQTGYAIQVSADSSFGDVVWDSGRTDSAEPFGVRYAGRALQSMHRYWWRVRVWHTTGDAPESEGDWSEPAWFETAILDPNLWQASWIGGATPASKQDDAVVYLRGLLDLGAEVVRARAYVSALGWYRLFVNGTDLTGHALVPRWTPFDQAVEYQTYDVTEALSRGSNVLALAVGDGRYRGGLGLAGKRNNYGTQVVAYAQVVAELADGTTVTAGSDKNWHAGPGRITGSDPKNGERADLRITDDDWLTGPAAPARFRPAHILADQAHPLIAEEVPRVHDVARLRATVSRAPSGAQILDFGQNFAGVTRIKLSGPTGRTVRLTHSELLTPDGELDTDYNLASSPKKWYQRETVVLGGRDEWYEPWFTIHGFRYVEVTGLDADIDPADVEGVVLSSDLPYSGTFTCSDPRLNQLHSNVVWSMRSNFTDTPTDCPTRERSGWTGDIQVFGPTATMLADSQAYLRRYLRNLALEQHPDGAVPLFIPSEQPTTGRGLGRRLLHGMSRSAGWADAAVMLPWTLYEYYGDRHVLERQYDSMRAWVVQMARAARNPGRGFPLAALHRSDLRKQERYILDTGFHFGEWLRPGENVVLSALRNVARPPAAIATAYFAHSSRLLARTAAVLGNQQDAERFEQHSIKVRAAWRAAFVHPDGRIGYGRQDDYVRALAFDLLLPEQRPAAVDRLAALIEAAGDHLDTGFLSTPLLLGVLVDNGRLDLATRLLFQSTNPSWLYQVERGATTVWETWEGYHADGRGKESHNHYALGSVAGWLTERLAGLSPAKPGWRTIRIAPLVIEQLSSTAATVDTPFGTARSAWHRRDGQIDLEVSVPAGAVAEIHTPDGPVHVGSGDHQLTWKSPI
ncbi:alpha-L-rhamnosidase [Actinoplanes lutulentus]|uniref:alpha-L-rhamnosidase n=1 Tax=Actinoplanes lutulentus TaxID=1287878 RepID=A0A327Z6E7_9ACTN|nr:alpha-L-rhamnosidase [Actinoplanes lutulentus]MBB2943338.1 alpha-L-rhamnosidase [Actinoplanes lutulentus]RAK28397.1 alpha-L-rhamnosidase [Actinoplanes lutulentus]